MRWILLVGTMLSVPAMAQVQVDRNTNARAQYPVDPATGNPAPAGTAGDPIFISGGGGGSGVDPRVAQGSTTAGQTGILTQGAVVSGDQAYTIGTTNPLNMTLTGRLKVGVSNAGNITPAAKLATTTTADLGACQYLATPPAWSDTWTGAVTCDATGAQRVSVGNFPASQAVTNAGTFVVQNNAATPAGANTIGAVNNLGAVTTAAPTYTTGTNSALSLTTAGALRTDASGSTQPVSGTVTANLGTLNGAATAANQNSTAAGTSATNAQGIQGVTGGVAVSTSTTNGATSANQTTELANQTSGGQKAQLVGTTGGSSVAVKQFNAGISPTDYALTAQAHTYNFDAGSSGFVSTVGNATGTYVLPKGTANLATAQVSVGTTATPVAAARAGRSRLIITQSAAGPCYYSSSATVSATTGARLTVVGASKTLQYAGIYYGICPGGAVSVDVDEEY